MIFVRDDVPSKILTKSNFIKDIQVAFIVRNISSTLPKW